MIINRKKKFLALAIAGSLIPYIASAEDTIIVSADNSVGELSKQANIGLLGNKDIHDTPFSIKGYTSKYIEDRQAKSLGDVIKNDSSVRVTAPSGGILDSFMIRGFPIGEGNIGEIALNGVYGVAPNYQLLPQYLERVELLKGPGAGLYGMSPNGGVGGVINAVTKRATAQDIKQLTTTWESNNQLGVYVDVGNSWVNPDGEMWGVRFNGGGSGGALALDNANKNTALGALAFDYEKGGFRASLDLLDQYQRVRSPNRPFAVSAGIDVPDAPDGKTNIAQKGMWWKIRDQGALLHTEYDINDNVTVFANAGGGRSMVSRMSEQTPNIINDKGDVVSTITNYRFNVNRYILETGARGYFTTGSIDHQMTLQTNYYHDRLAVAGTRGQTLDSNIYSPSDVDFIIPSAPVRVPKISSSQLSGLAFADTMTLLDGSVDITPGVRFQRVRSDNFAANGDRSSTYDESAVTPMLGLVYRPWKPVSLYANYIEGLSKGDVAPGSAQNAGQVMRPYRSRQYEVGIKYDEAGIQSSLALFQITKPSGAIDSNNTFNSNSEQRNRGIELNISHELLDNLRMSGSLSLIDAELIKSPTSGVRGNKPVGVSPVQANAGVEYDLPVLWGLSLNSHVNYSGKQYVNQANTQSIRSWTTVDMGAAYKTRVYGTPATFRFDVQNVLDRHYWAGVASYSTIAQGAPRTFLASVTVDF
ncbi:TonB-dependent siderophore receptor [Salmonella enterica]|nr:TonB-dependent siderophore receptor [Salmonella enterica]